MKKDKKMEKNEQPQKSTFEEDFLSHKEELINFSLWMDSMRRSTIDNDEKLLDNFLKSNSSFDEIFGNYFDFLLSFSLWMDSMRRTTVKNEDELFDDFYIANVKPKSPAELTIIVTQEELKTFYDDVAGEQTGWSDSSYRLAKFIGIDPTQGL
jgi:hypothetical protein